MWRRLTGCVLVAAVLTACSDGGRDSGPDGGPAEPGHATPSEGGRPLEAPSWAPLKSPAVASTTPSPLTGTPSVEEAEEAGKTDRTRADAEQFALAVAHLTTDVRYLDKGAAALAAIASDSLPEDARLYLIDEIEGQRDLGTRRQYDTRLEQWIRSEVAGPADRPDRVNVEFAANLRSDPMKFHAWYRERYDVAWEDGRWQLVGYGAGRFGPHTSANLTPAEQREFLDGPGWRRIPPA